MRFKNRSTEKEILDCDEISTVELNKNLDELNVINHYLGGYAISKKGLKEILVGNQKITTLLDLGFGGGHSILELSKYSNSIDRKLFYYGVDLKQDCVDFSKKTLADIPNKELICDNYKNLSQEFLAKVDIIHCSLFLHHLSNKEIVELLKFAKTNNCILLINDLQRHWLAYYSISILTKLFSGSRLVKNDARLSVLRGFKKHELIELMLTAGFRKFKVKWCWAFRYLIIAEK